MMKRQSNGGEIKINLSPKQILYCWLGFVVIIVAYYLMRFGFEPIQIDLEEYWLFQGKKRSINKNPIYIMMNSFLLPDKSSTLLGLFGSLVQSILALLSSQKTAPNALTRLAWITSLIGLLPLGFTLFFDICLLISLLIVFLGPVALLFFLIRWVVRGKWN
jgi:hypothetical protein